MTGRGVVSSVVLGLTLIVVCAGATPRPTVAPECTCVVPVDERGEPLSVPAQMQQKQVVLVATALREEHGEDYAGPGRQRVTLLPEASWGEPVPDTVSLVVKAACAVYVAGGRYLVAGDMENGALVPTGCGPAYSMDHWSAPFVVSQLGPPVWRSGGPADPQLHVALHGRIVNTVTGRPVENAHLRVPDSDRGARTSGEGRFTILGVEDDPPIRVVVEHPCFHTVEVQLETSYDSPLEIGLPFREPRGPAGEPVPGACAAYRPARQ